MKRNGVDLTEELRMQGWETYFQCLYGPMYTNLVKEFWRFADSDDHYIVSYEINPTIFQQNAEGKHSKNKELHQNLRVWLKIILGTIHHRPASNSSDYINTDQKCILYYIHKGPKLYLPALLFKYLRDSVKDTRNNMKTRNYIPLGRLISDVLIESGLVDHLIQLRLMEDVTIDIGRPLNARNLKSMGIIDQVRAKPTLDTSWEALKDQREIPNGLYLLSNIDPQEVVAYYLQDLANQGVDISEFSVDWLPEQPPNFMKRTQEPSDKSKKANKARLGESFEIRPPVPLVVSPSKFVPLSRSLKIKPIASSLPQTTPIYTSSKTPPSTTRSFNPPSLKFNLDTTTLPVSEEKMLNETTSPSSSPSPQSPPYYVLSSDNEPSDPQSPPLAHLQARALASQQPSHPEPKPEVTSPPPEHPNPTTSEPPQTPPPTQNNQIYLLNNQSTLSRNQPHNLNNHHNHHLTFPHPSLSLPP
ncbi:hypothetical protein KIW84_053668 [Lathyrus oleraceus]|uniref:Uncharacterized protein n=1 Tax=Pisum sativum TaxID=3888 RepID=A0A9D5AJ31_PEA|nr:hypothetical protein KIW84_053668 [Pisum sativum]